MNSFMSLTVNGSEVANLMLQTHEIASVFINRDAAAVIILKSGQRITVDGGAGLIRTLMNGMEESKKIAAEEQTRSLVKREPSKP